MNPITPEIAATVVRALMIFFGPKLAEWGIGETEITQWVGALISLSGFGWGVYAKIQARRKLLTAIAMPEGATEADVDATVRVAHTLPPIATPKDVPPAPPTYK